MTLHFIPLSDEILYSDQLEEKDLVPFHLDRQCVRQLAVGGPKRVPGKVEQKGADLGFPDWLGSLDRIRKG